MRPRLAPIVLRSRVWATLAVAGLVLVTLALRADAQRFGPRLDAFEMEFQARSAALAGDLTKDQTKDKKLYDGALSRLAQDSTTLRGDILLAKKSVVKIEKKKPTDGTIAALRADVVSGLATDIGTELEVLQADVNDETAKVSSAQIQKTIDKARAKLAGVAIATKTSKQIGALLGAEALTRKAAQLLGKFPIPTGLRQQAYVKASNTSPQSWMEAIALEGDTLVVGSRLESSSGVGVDGDQGPFDVRASGSVYVYVRTGGTWMQQAYLKASNAGEGHVFGIAVAISGNTIVVGAAGEDSDSVGVNGEQGSQSGFATSGAAYVFTREGTTWTQQAYLKASNTNGGDGFGRSVAISGNTIVVGAFAEDSSAVGVNGDQNNDAAPHSGAAYVFVRQGVDWTQQAYLKASNTSDVSRFGSTVTIDANTIVVGSPDEDGIGFGVNGSQVIDKSDAPNRGSAYVFTRSGMTWSQQAYLKPSNDGNNFTFGDSLDVDGDTLVVGASHESSFASGVNGKPKSKPLTWSGAAYIFQRAGVTWTQQALVKASKPSREARFAQSVCIDGDRLAVGSPFEDSSTTGIGAKPGKGATDSGAVYLFKRTGSTWSVGEFVKAPNTDVGDWFGIGVALSGNTLAVTAGLEDSSSMGINGNPSDNTVENAGATYIYVR